MNNILGKVTVSPSGVGIPDLLVVVYDVDPNAKPEEIIQGLPDALPGRDGRSRRRAAATTLPVQPGNQLGFLGDRIGSVLTGQDGAFSLSYDDSEYRVRNPEEKRPDLFLMLFVPERAGRTVKELLLFYSPEIRQNAGKTETFFIQVSEAQLAEKDFPLPQPPTTSTDAKIATYRRQVEAEARFNEAVTAVQKEKIAARQEDLASRKTDFRKVLVSEVSVTDDFTTFVAEGETVGEKKGTHLVKETDKVNAAIARQVEQKKGVEVTFILNAAEKNALGINVTSDALITLTSAQLEGIRAKLNAAGGDNLVITSDNPILKACLHKSDSTHCAEAKLEGGEQPPPETEGAPAVDEGLLTPQDIARFVNRVLTDLRLNVGPDGPGLVRGDTDTVDASVNKFSLRKGPAELPSFFDFNVLQVAFGHIWQQLVDEEPAALAAEASVMAGERGYRLDFSRAVAAHGVLGTFNDLFNAYSNPPQAVVANFDITYEEWNALDPAYQNKLEEICAAIDKANAGLIYDPDGSVTKVLNITVTQAPGFVRVSTYAAEQFLQKLREQGELIIDYVRCNNGRSFHRILTDLDSALKSNYVFTVFGADATAKAVNFGLLNTYRQKWEPTAYQVGDLVKSIPLAPKEERKYALKTTFNRKRSEKEAKKNNTSLQQEQNTTARAEEEIVNKAQTKTDFKISAEAEFSKWKISSSLGFDAVKDSQQSKKDFRESVLKSTQEFKEERSVEIDTEETFGTEATESGTISNPNDELAITYLFYELQKRFKVSEQLYRIMPVVMVAQDVPAPNEITEAWIIAHDWILNRYLLDDSFRPALQYIARKNVGDDYAIRELRKNLRTQRQLVETLKRELSILRKESDNRYVALEAAIDTRIAEESDRNTDSFWDNVGEFFGGDKEDPEGAKSREMAAKDAHAYAVEKAEKLAAALQREVSTTHQLTADYNKAMRDHLDKKTMVARLKTHLKNNIIYYMQAIWSLESPDQRYMRVLNTEVPFLEFGDITCELRQRPEEDLFAEFRNKDLQETMHRAWVKAAVTQGVPKPLVEVADLDTPLGYMGNYIVFPLKQHNALTELMAMPYVDASFGAMDPDQLSNVSLEDYARYVCCLEEKLSEEDFNTLVPALKAWLKRLLSDPLRNGDEIILPTNSLYIEILASANTMLEDFKLAHREWDVYKVREEVRMQALENLRYAKRILMDNLDDPNIEKKISVQGLPGISGINVGED